jgi:N-acetyl-anhydromuramyl-L-alanine amidase AmpD
VPKKTRPSTAAKPAIVQDPIPYGAARRAEMAQYARRHYGVASSTLHPKLIVLHFTASGAGSYPGVHATFASDAPNGGELPGVCAHFVVDQDGTIYQLVPLDLMCRHTIGVNDRAIGIEMIQSAGSSSHWADQQILHRPAQIGSVLRLVRWLRATYGISKSNVIGHAMANDSPYFHDLEGWRNDHTDWQPEDVAQVRSML